MGTPPIATVLVIHSRAPDDDKRKVWSALTGEASIATSPTCFVRMRRGL